MFLGEFDFILMHIIKVMGISNKIIRGALLLCCMAISNNLMAANESSSMGILTAIVAIILVLVVLVVGFIYIRTLHNNISIHSDQIFHENQLLAEKNNEIDKQFKAAVAANVSLQEQYKQDLNRIGSMQSRIDELQESNSELTKKTSDQEVAISTLNSNKANMEQLLLHKIKENDSIQRDAAEKLAAAELRLKDAATIHDSFFVDTIHEMRTPLSLVLGSLALCVQNDDPANDMSTQLLSAYRNALSLQDLADQLIGLQKINDTTDYLRIARYDIVEITRQISDIFVDWQVMNNIDFHIEAQNPALWVWIDRRKMEFSLRMLLTNAFKNTFAYGKVSVDISVIQESGVSYCALAVKDEGLDESKSVRRGLKQVEDMASAMGGMFRNTNDNECSIYTLYIKLGKQHLMDRRVEFIEPEGDLVKLNARQKEEIAELIQVTPQKKVTGKKLLVVDDSDQIRWFLKHVFSKEYEILEARDGAEGVEVAKREEPDVVLCDVMMPVKDGFTACREIKSVPELAQTPVVMLTAKVESEDVLKGLEAGADDYITKPFDIEILRSKINGLMKRHDGMKRYFMNVKPSNGDSSAVDENKSAIPDNPFMDAVVKNIEKHLDDSTFEAKVLADHLNMSLPTLYRKIKQYSDLSILELTRNIRLKKAAELLASQRYSVQEVAEMVGFNDTATFRKRFTEQYGTTPSQYGVPN